MQSALEISNALSRFESWTESAPLPSEFIHHSLQLLDLLAQFAEFVWLGGHWRREVSALRPFAARWLNGRPSRGRLPAMFAAGHRRTARVREILLEMFGNVAQSRQAQVFDCLMDMLLARLWIAALVPACHRRTRAGLGAWSVGRAFTLGAAALAFAGLTTRPARTARFRVWFTALAFARRSLSFGTRLAPAFTFFTLFGRTVGILAPFIVRCAQSECERGKRSEAKTGQCGMCFHAVTFVGVRWKDGSAGASAKGDLQNFYIRSGAAELTRLRCGRDKHALGGLPIGRHRERVVRAIEREPVRNHFVERERPLVCAEKFDGLLEVARLARP